MKYFEKIFRDFIDRDNGRDTSMIDFEKNRIWKFQ